MENQRSSDSLFAYDVFLTFHPEDVHFAKNIKKTFSDRGVPIFTAYYMLSEGGGGITSQLLNIMQNSKTFMIVFSENFFASTLCLQILDQMLDYSNIIDKVVARRQYFVPVYYNVKPYDPSLRRWIDGYDLVPQTQEDFLIQGNRDTVMSENVAAYNRRSRAEFKFNDGDGSELEFINKFVERIVRLHSLRACNSISYKIREYFQTKTTWRVVGIISTIVGLLCYTMSPCFGRLNLLKVILTGLVTFLIITTLLCADQTSPFPRLNKPQHVMCFVALIIISVYSFF